MRIRPYVTTLMLIAGLGAGAWVLGRMQPVRQVASSTPGDKLFQTVFAHVRQYSVDGLADEELYRRAAQGVIDELDDPYAVLVLPGERVRAGGDLPSPQGIYLDRRDGGLVIVTVVPGSPAAALGLRSGDRLLAVASTGVDATRLPLAERLLGGAPGSRVTIRIGRSGAPAGLQAVELVRGPVPPLPTVAGEALAGGVARIQVRRFVPGVADSVSRSLETLLRAGSRSLVLDLRGAVGGELDDGARLADLFLDRGTLLVRTRARPAAESRSYTDSTPSPFRAVPLAVLIDAGTAGAAEVAAGAIQDHDRGAVLGETSFGRGVSQSTFDLGGGAALRLTTALWMTPSGRQIQQAPRAAGDSTPRPSLKSDAGRTLRGGGGIVPDRTVEEHGPADFALAEARSLLARAGSAREVLALLAEY